MNTIFHTMFMLEKNLDITVYTCIFEMNVLGKCNELGTTSQCDGITECTLSSQGFGVCTCPVDTFGPPQCLGNVFP